MDELLTTEQLAQALGVPAETIANNRNVSRARGIPPLLPFEMTGPGTYVYRRSALEKLLSSESGKRRISR